VFFFFFLKNRTKTVPRCALQMYSGQSDIMQQKHERQQPVKETYQKSQSLLLFMFFVR